MKGFGFPLIVALAMLTLSPAKAAPTCSALAPNSDPEVNYQSIVDCLSGSEHAAHLATGVFPINRKIKMPERATLSGSPGAVLKAVDGADGYKDNSIIELTGEDKVSQVSFVGDGRLKPGCCTTVVAITGSGSTIENADISDVNVDRRASEPEKVRTAGLYFIGAPTSSENLGSHLKIHGLNFGVIFRKGLPASAHNRIANSEIFDLSCDAVTFSGGGIAEGNRLHDTGFDCKQHPTPIPGGGFYALNNSEPVVIANNTVTEVCGAAIDIFGAENFTIVGNKINQRSAPLKGRYPYCNGFPAKLVDVSHFTVKNNTFYVADAPPLGVAYKFFPQFRHSNAAIYGLTPNSEQQIYAMRLMRQNKAVVGNVFENNKFIAECSASGPCAGGGVGLFVGPGVGDGASNKFIGNTFVGTSVAAVKCGRDTYERNQSCRKSDGVSGCASEAEAKKSAEAAQTFDACAER